MPLGIEFHPYGTSLNYIGKQLWCFTTVRLLAEDCLASTASHIFVFRDAFFVP